MQNQELSPIDYPTERGDWDTKGKSPISLNKLLLLLLLEMPSYREMRDLDLEESLQQRVQRENTPQNTRWKCEKY